MITFIFHSQSADGKKKDWSKSFVVVIYTVKETDYSRSRQISERFFWKKAFFRMQKPSTYSYRCPFEQYLPPPPAKVL